MGRLSRSGGAVGRWRPRSEHALALATLAGGLLLILLVARSTQHGLPPLYDGVVPEDPYRYLAPAAGQPGDAPAYSGTIAVTGTTTPNIVASTSEIPPQAQPIASPEAFD